MDDLEQQLAAWVDAQNDGVAPVGVDEVVDRGAATAPTTDAPRRRGRRVAFTAVAVAAALITAIGLAGVVDRDDPPEVVQTSDPDQTVPPGWATLEVPELGWTVTAPSAWSSSIWNGHCDGTTGILVVNGPLPLARSTDPDGCNSEWDPAGKDRPDLVALAIVDDPRVAGSGPAPGPDTQLPLTIDDLGAHDRADGEPLVRTMGVIRDGDPSHHLEVWIGDDAPSADVETLQRVLASLAWNAPDRDRPTEARTVRGSDLGQATGSPRMTTFLVCMADEGFHPVLSGPPSGMIDGVRGAVVTWPAGEQDRPGYDASYQRCNEQAGAMVRRNSEHDGPWRERPGISQSAADARRDRTVPAVAALPLAERATTTHWFDTPEGTWALSTMPERPAGTDCVIGDPEGTYGVDHVCSTDYGEVLLVDRSGSIVRAYPMPGEAPDWIFATEEAVYAGRVGEGDRPESTIARIDRTSLESEVLVFPADDGVLGVDWPNWSIAPDGTDVADLVRVGDDSGTLVDSTIGVTSIDLPAVEELFA